MTGMSQLCLDVIHSLDPKAEPAPGKSSSGKISGKINRCLKQTQLLFPNIYKQERSVINIHEPSK